MRTIVLALGEVVGLDGRVADQIDRAFILGSQIQQQRRDDLLAGPQLLGFDYGGRQSLDSAGKVDEGAVDQLLVLLSGEKSAPKSHLHTGNNVVLNQSCKFISRDVNRLRNEEASVNARSP